MLKPGTRAPDFTLRSTPDQEVSLSEFRGQPAIRCFYPADWRSGSGKCTTRCSRTSTPTFFINRIRHDSGLDALGDAFELAAAAKVR